MAIIPRWLVLLSGYYPDNYTMIPGSAGYYFPFFVSRYSHLRYNVHPLPQDEPRRWKTEKNSAWPLIEIKGDEVEGSSCQSEANQAIGVQKYMPGKIERSAEALRECHFPDIFSSNRNLWVNTAQATVRTETKEFGVNLNIGGTPNVWNCWIHRAA